MNKNRIQTGVDSTTQETLRRLLERAVMRIPIFDFTVTRLVIWNTRRKLKTMKYNGIRLYVPNTSGVAAGEGHERLSTSLFASKLHPGDNVLDIGANVGHYTMSASKLVGKGFVHSFEPDPFTFGLLRLNRDLNKAQNVVLHNVAVSNTNGKMKLYLAPSNAGAHSLYNQPPWRPSVLVDVATVDSLIDTRIHIAKIDVEGNEVRVLEGMSETINRSPGMRLIVELNPQALASSGASSCELIELLESLGFQISLIDEVSKRLLPELSHAQLRQQLETNGGYANLFCRSAAVR